MAEQLVISNEYISVTISARGAEMQSINKGGKEILWDGNPEVWAAHAPVLFPICGGLKEDKFILDGKEYTVQKHGYARFEEFEVEYSDKEKAVFLLRSNEESLKSFPFEYELRIIYTLDGCKVNIEYNVKNLSKGDMYFSIGSHEGYACPEGIEEYSIVFDKCEDLDSSILDGNLLEYNTVNVGKNTCELPLRYEYFAVDALVFLSLKSRKLSLKNKATGETVGVEFDGADYLLLWTKPGAKYICIEPWSGIPDFVDSDFDITNKKGITKLGANDTYVKKHSITA